MNLNSAHDVRHLRTCAFCKSIGDVRHMISMTPNNGWLHGCCFIKQFGIGGLRDLPNSVTDTLTLDDIGVDAMKALLNDRPAIPKPAPTLADRLRVLSHQYTYDSQSARDLCEAASIVERATPCASAG